MDRGVQPGNRSDLEISLPSQIAHGCVSTSSKKLTRTACEQLTYHCENDIYSSGSSVSSGSDGPSIASEPNHMKSFTVGQTSMLDMIEGPADAVSPAKISRQSLNGGAAEFDKKHYNNCQFTPIEFKSHGACWRGYPHLLESNSLVTGPPNTIEASPPARPQVPLYADVKSPRQTSRPGKSRRLSASPSRMIQSGTNVKRESSSDNRISLGGESSGFADLETAHITETPRTSNRPSVNCVTALNNSPLNYSMSPSVSHPSPISLSLGRSASETSSLPRTPIYSASTASSKSSSAADSREIDEELRQVAINSLSFPIERAAQHVREDEGGPLAEKSRKVFGMSWLMRNCQVSPGSNIPRNRVYAGYVATCANLDLRPLTHASFGKLVRSLFPGIKTRRLGVRGQSKYHYCGIFMHGLPSASQSPEGVHYPHTSQGASLPSSPSTHNVFDRPSCTPRAWTGRPSVTKHSPISDSESYLGPATGRTGQYSSPDLSAEEAGSRRRSGSVSLPLKNTHNPVEYQEYLSNDKNTASHTSMASPPSSAFRENVSRSQTGPNLSAANYGLPSLPSLVDFVDNTIMSGVDSDLWITLWGLFRAHFRSFLDLFDEMDIKGLLKLVGSFGRSITGSLQPLLNEPQLHQWVVACDAIIYCHTLEILSRIVLLQLPPNFIERLQMLTTELPIELRNQTQRFPAAFAMIKNKSASPYVDMLSRFLRVNRASVDSTNLLKSSDNTVVMRQEWLDLVTPMATKLPAPYCHQPEISRYLSHDIPNLLTASASSLEPLQAWVSYFTSLSEHYTKTSFDILRMLVSFVATAALRDISGNNGRTFHDWWRLHCWVDEWMAWKSELCSFECPHVAQ